MTEPFYESEVVRDEMRSMEDLYVALAQQSMNFASGDIDRKEHVNKTLELIAKQKVFYARLALLSHQDEEAREIKLRIDTMTKMYSNGKHINQVLDEMEEKLRRIKKSLS